MLVLWEALPRAGLVPESCSCRPLSKTLTALVRDRAEYAAALGVTLSEARARPC
ncbi:MAG: hypothetical protein WDO24_09650 [Pseudomonadota bacterium]